MQVTGDLFDNYDMNSRTYYNHKVQIRKYFQFREPTAEDANFMTKWLSKYVFYYDANTETLKEKVYSKFRHLHIEPPTSERIIKSSIATYEKSFFEKTFNKLSRKTIVKIDNLLNDLTSHDESEIDDKTEEFISFSELRADPGRIGLDSIFKEITKLKTIKFLELLDDLFSNISQKLLRRYKLRAVSEKLTELPRHPENIKYTILAAFFWLRCREITDNLIELLMQIIHKIGVRAERKVEKEFINDFRKVNGKYSFSNGRCCFKQS